METNQDPPVHQVKTIVYAGKRVGQNNNAVYSHYCVGDDTYSHFKKKMVSHASVGSAYRVSFAEDGSYWHAGPNGRAKEVGNANRT